MLADEQARRVVALAADLARAGQADALAEFLDHGLPVDTQAADGNSLLMLAAYHGRDATVRLLLERGADPDLPNDRGQCALAGALFKGEDAIVRLLVTAGADLDAGTPSARATAAMFGRDHLLSPPRD